MQIDEQFNLIAEEYDGNRRRFIPCYDDFYETTTRFLAFHRNPPTCVLDLGAGTGLLTSFWYPLFPQTQYILTDIAQDMLQIARKRFANCRNVSFRVENYAETLPAIPFDTAISALSIHHLPHAEKARLFARLYERLPEGGIFVNYDQFCAHSPALDKTYNAYWEAHLRASGLTANDLALWQERRKLDKECSTEYEIRLLRRAGFATAECVYSRQKFSVIAAIK